MFSPSFLTLSLAILFVAVLYLIPARVRALPRNHLEHVKWRMASLVPVLVVAPMLSRLALEKVNAGASLWRALGAAPSCWTMTDTLAPLLLIAVLFFGPLIQVGLNTRHLLKQDGEGRKGNKAVFIERFLLALLASLHVDPVRTPPLLHFRTLVFAPLVEEWVFRACIVPVWIISGHTVSTSILAAALAFGFAHCHHGYELRRSGHPWPSVIVTVLVQLSYTSLFGGIAAWLLLAYGNTLAVILVHAFCNLLGLPDVSWLSSSDNPLVRHRWMLLVSYVIGLGGFIWAITAVNAFPPTSDAAPCALVR